ncbi:hypothetical protein [Novosphingobium malaysiense]|nr:hypothetical protein [Novosphingobium malaysiense]
MKLTFEGHALPIAGNGAVFPSGKAFGFNAFLPRNDDKANDAEGDFFEG